STRARRCARVRPSRRRARAGRSSACKCRSRSRRIRSRRLGNAIGQLAWLLSLDWFGMDFRRIHELPPYVFATVDQLKRELRREGRDVIDLGFGNPDIPSPDVAVEKLAEAALRPVNHRYSASRGLPNLRSAICERYAAQFGVELDPDVHAVSTIGAKEGLAHLMWVLAEPGDTVVVPSPSYPIHLVAPRLAGATVVHAFELDIEAAIHAAEPSPRAVIISFPHNPTTAVATQEQLQRLVDLAREREFVLVHDFAYADIAFDGH